MIHGELEAHQPRRTTSKSAWITGGCGAKSAWITGGCGAKSAWISAGLWCDERVLRRPLALAITTLAAVAVAATTLAASAPAAQAQPALVVLTLRSGSALAQHSTRPPDSADERTERAAAVAPRSRRTVERWLADHGFAVESSTGWTVTARGPAHRLTRRLPRELRAAVVSAVPEVPARQRPHAVPTGWAPDQLRLAYDATTGDGSGTTIATIQFSGWQPSDAQVFARAAGIDLQPGQITTIPVAGAQPDVPDGSGGDFEVAFDVQAALGAAPAARQRVYVAPNTMTGAVAVYDAVAGDAERLGLTAVSISWGACEQSTSPQLVQSLEQSLARMVAAGATVFAASGDAGAYGCGAPGDPDPRLAVDYPASSPSVVAVGGTTLRRENGGWVETAWSDASTGAGTGGGLSTLFARPVWQPGAGPRAVPDLSAVADPQTGIGVYGPDVDGRRRWLVAGGTSGSAPLLAGGLTSTISGLGRTLGFGRLHVPLYAAARDGVGLRDITRGDNLRHLAGPGHDLATGLGSPQWSALGPRLVQPHVLAPTATTAASVSVTPYAPVSRTARYGLAETVEQACAQDQPVPPTALELPGADRATAVVLAVIEADGCRTATAPLVLDRTAPTSAARLGTTTRPGVLALSWTGSDDGSGIAQVGWSLRRTDTGQVVTSGVAPRSGSALRSVRTGPSYVLEVTATDAVGWRSGRATSVAVSP